MSEGSKRTWDAVCRYMMTLRAPQYQILLKPSDEMLAVISKTLTISQMNKEIGFFRRKNANGYHVYGRPISQKFILVDDLMRCDIDTMIADGLRPNVVIETSRDNYQAWLCLFPDKLTEPTSRIRGTDNYEEWLALRSHLIDGDIPRATATAAARLLAETYGGDMGSANAGHLGRLPQFTNRKPMHKEEDGRFFWTRDAYPPTQNIGLAVLDLLRKAIAAAETKRSSMPFSPSPQGGCVPNAKAQTELSEPVAQEFYHAVVNELADKFGAEFPLNDRSRIDFSVARHLCYFGYAPHEVEVILQYGSEKAKERGMDYVRITVSNAFSKAA